MKEESISLSLRQEINIQMREDNGIFKNFWKNSILTRTFSFESR